MRYLRDRECSGRQFIDIHRERSEAILRIVDAGWKRVSDRPEVHPGAGEVEITERLRDGMRAALAERATDLSRKMTVLPGTESRSSTEVLRPDGRTDVPIFFSDIREEYNEHDPHAIVECKRVAGSCADLCREYVVEGINRFVTGKYAEKSCGRLHGRVPAFRRRRVGNRRHQCAPDPQAASGGASGTLRRVRLAVGEKQPSSTCSPPHSPSPCITHSLVFGRCRLELLVTLERHSSRRRPLDASFLKPRLEGARSYDRIAGYFSSSILEVAGEAFEQVQGSVRIVCNSQMSRADVEIAKAARAAMRREWCESRPEALGDGARPRFPPALRRPALGQARRPCAAGRGLRPDPREGWGDHPGGWPADVLPRQRQRVGQRVPAELRARMGGRRPGGRRLGAAGVRRASGRRPSPWSLPSSSSAISTVSRGAK